MGELVLITGGAGFIGSHLADRLLARGDRVRLFDNLTPQVHIHEAYREYLDPEAELVLGDLLDEENIARSLRGVDSVVHLAARVGVGQSAYEIAAYTAANVAATGVLLDAIREHEIRKLVVASSMCVYGEGLHENGRANPRSRRQLEADDWEPYLRAGLVRYAGLPHPTSESFPPELRSVYALTKYDQELLCLLFGEAYSLPTVALRLFNTYGPRQALTNPYTGVLAIFAGRLLNGQPLVIYEDGLQRRDFVSVHDVARAFELALHQPKADGQVFNVASGENTDLLELASKLELTLGTTARRQIDGIYRFGDVRHCFGSTLRARQVLGFKAEVTLAEGLRELVGWLVTQSPAAAKDATEELLEHGLTV